MKKKNGAPGAIALALTGSVVSAALRLRVRLVHGPQNNKGTPDWGCL
jgi:hypothetical protein